MPEVIIVIFLFPMLAYFVAALLPPGKMTLVAVIAAIVIIVFVGLYADQNPQPRSGPLDVRNAVRSSTLWAVTGALVIAALTQAIGLFRLGDEDYPKKTVIITGAILTFFVVIGVAS